MKLKLVGWGHYRGNVDGQFVELVKGEEVECSEAAGKQLLSFPGWFEEVKAAGKDARATRKAKRDRMARGGSSDR